MHGLSDERDDEDIPAPFHSHVMSATRTIRNCTSRVSKRWTSFETIYILRKKSAHLQETKQKQKSKLRKRGVYF